MFERAVQQAHLADAKDLECIALSNMAAVEHCLLRPKAAIDKSTEALALLNELPLTHPELMNEKYSVDHRRLYISILIRSGNYTQAEMSVKQFQFSERETNLLLAGCKFLSGQFESAKNLLEACAVRINDDGSMSANSSIILRRHASNMYERTEADLNEEEQCMFAALVLYNLAVVYGISHRHLDMIGLYDRTIKILSRICILPHQKMSKSELTDKLKLHSSTKYLIFNIQRKMDATSLDSILAPAALLAQTIAARAEAFFISSCLPGATNIELGQCLPSDQKASLSETEILSNELNDAFRSYLDSHPNLSTSLTPDETATPAVGKAVALKRQHSRSGSRATALSMTTPLTPQESVGVDSSPDLLRAQEILGPFRRLLGACSGGKEASGVTTETIQSMKLLRLSGRATASSQKGVRSAAPTPPSVGSLPRLSSADKMFEPTEESTSRAPGFENAVKSLPKCSNSVRANMLIVSENFQPRSLLAMGEVSGSRGSRKDGSSKTHDPDIYAASVVEWALMICEGASLGILGVPMITVNKDFSERRRDKERDRIRAEAKGAREKLQECLQNNKPNSPAVLMSLYATLAKLCLHLGLRSDAGSNIALMEDVVHTLNQKRPIALARKFRVDYEEWLMEATTASTTPSQVRLKKIQSLLGYVKEYYAAAKECDDFNLYRDACKRLMNIYVDISNIPDPLGTPPREMGTLEELTLFTATQIEESEATDILWMKLYSKARAIIFMRELKTIGKPCQPEAELEPVSVVFKAPPEENSHSAEGNENVKGGGGDAITVGESAILQAPPEIKLPPGMSFGFESFDSPIDYQEDNNSVDEQLDENDSTGW